MGVADHMQLLRAFRPNLFECLYDFAPSRENKMKRVREVVGRDKDTPIFCVVIDT